MLLGVCVDQGKPASPKASMSSGSLRWVRRRVRDVAAHPFEVAVSSLGDELAVLWQEGYLVEERDRLVVNLRRWTREKLLLWQMSRLGLPDYSDGDAPGAATA